MHSIVLKYVQLVCITLWFDYVSCDSLLLEDAQNYMLLDREIHCTEDCMDTNSRSHKTAVRT